MTQPAILSLPFRPLADQVKQAWPLRLVREVGASRVAHEAALPGKHWEVWNLQIAAGHEPCFATPQRFVCGEAGCEWYQRCHRLRAEWLR